MKIDPPEKERGPRPHERIDSDDYHSLFDYEDD